MSRTSSRVVVTACALALSLSAAASTQAHPDHQGEPVDHHMSDPMTADRGDPIVLAQAGGTETPELEPRYQPVPGEEPDGYNEDYIFAITRALVDSTIVPAAKAPLFLLTVPLDLALLPITLIGGFFG